MATSSKDELISKAKEIAQKAIDSGELENTSPELIQAITSATSHLKDAARGDAGLTALVDQINSLVQATKKD